MHQAAVKATKIDYDALTLRLRAQIADRTSALDDVARAIVHLGYAVEGTEFWTRIANDSSYSTPHRRKCIFALFRRYGLIPNDVAWLAKMLNTATWLSDGDVQAVPSITSWIPVTPSQNCTTFKIKVLSDKYSVYIVVMGENISPNALGQALRHNQAWEVGLQNSIITEIGLIDEFTQGEDSPPKPLPMAMRMDGQSVKDGYRSTLH